MAPADKSTTPTSLNEIPDAIDTKHISRRHISRMFAVRGELSTLRWA